ncbi:MAG: hypothetical protein D6773_12185, partial [Alphaproteobacteria bacterium]
MCWRTPFRRKDALPDMQKLRILHLSDDRPGHYHLSEGVMAALGRLRETSVERVQVRRRRVLPARLLRAMSAGPDAARHAVLRVGYGISPAALPAADLVISAGGET